MAINQPIIQSSILQRSLPGGFKGAAPQTSSGIHFFSLVGDQFHGDVDKLVVPVADQHARSAAHSSMNAVAT